MSLTDRIAEAFRDIVREFMAPDASDDVPPWAYFVPWEYQVASVTDTTFTGRATSSRCPWPDLVGAPNLPGVAGTLIKPALNSLVAVAFLNGDPTRPRVVAWDQAVPQSIGIAGNGPAVHRVGDLGDGGTFTMAAPGQLTWTGPDGSVWNATFQSAAPGNPVVIALIPVTNPGNVGKIITKATTGSSIVKAGP
jgi:hypothetical protein